MDDFDKLISDFHAKRASFIAAREAADAAQKRASDALMHLNQAAERLDVWLEAEKYQELEAHA